MDKSSKHMSSNSITKDLMFDGAQAGNKIEGGTYPWCSSASYAYASGCHFTTCTFIRITRQGHDTQASG